MQGSRRYRCKERYDRSFRVSRGCTLHFNHENLEEDDNPRTSARNTLRRLLPYVRPYRRVFGLAAITVSIITACELAGPWLLGRIIDVAISKGTGAEILALSGAYFLTFVVAAGTG